MPAATFYQPMEAIFDGHCEYEYYNQNEKSFSAADKSRICHLKLQGQGEYNSNAILMIFTIRNQPSATRRYVWKIHSEGPKRTDAGSTVPLRNTAEKLAKKRGWKYIAVAVAAEDVPQSDIVSRYVISMESYLYGNDTVYDLSDDLQKISELGEPDFYRCNANVNGTFFSLAFIKKDHFLEYVKLFDSRPYSKPTEIEKYQEGNEAEPVIEANETVRTTGGLNKIYYGAPGCGKSHIIKAMLEDVGVAKENKIRTTFHPEYSNSDFIGQILPTVELAEDGTEKVRYIFNPGPFSIALKTAYNTGDMVYLVVEEINRGNAAAIFGDMFQLLDRVKDSDSDVFGESEYFVCNPNMQKYLMDNVKASDVLGRLEEGVYIPSNLTILATMNTSDQNVFTLDTAFKRRWSFEQISNDIINDTEHTYKGWFIPGTEVTWEQFLVAINNKILEYKIHNQTNEDKRLGKYFVTKDCLTEEPAEIADVQDVAKNFAYKVLEYVWNDVCKIGREDWFDTESYRTLEDLINAFIKPTASGPLSVFQNLSFES